MKKILLPFLLFFVLVDASAQLNHKVVGYLPSYRFSLVNSIDLTKVTHVDLSFANPDIDGNLIYDNYQGNGNFGPSKNISSVVETIHAAGPKVLISLAGGGLWGDEVLRSRYDSLMTTARPAFIAKIVDYIDANNLDGIDIDIEGDFINANLGPFVTDLADTCHQRGWEVSAAWPGSGHWANQIPDDALDALDYLNIMSYDQKGSWTPNSPGQHATYAAAVADIAYWKGRGLEGSRLCLGLPFYGYEWNGTVVTAFTYGQKVAEDPSYADLDNVGDGYYNGRPTIRQKVQLAMDEELAGVMIWALGQDSYDEYSLLTAIYEKLTVSGTAAPVDVQNAVTVYPMPASEVLSVNSTKAKILSYELLASNGKPVKSEEFLHHIEVASIKEGTYILKLNSDQGDISKLVIIE